MGLLARVVYRSSANLAISLDPDGVGELLLLRALPVLVMTMMMMTMVVMTMMTMTMVAMMMTTMNLEAMMRSR